MDFESIRLMKLRACKGLAMDMETALEMAALAKLFPLPQKTIKKVWLPSGKKETRNSKEDRKKETGGQMIIQGKFPGSTHPMNLVVEREIITRIEPLQERVQPDFGGPDLYICGGFFDPPVNGFAGVDFNGKDFNPDGLHRAARGLASSKVIRFLSTLMIEVHGPR
jgi:hypothetical protein